MRRKHTTSGSPALLSRRNSWKTCWKYWFQAPTSRSLIWRGCNQKKTNKQTKNIFLTRTSVNAAVSDLKSRLWENHQYLEPLRKECSTAAEFELSNKPNPHVIDQSSAIHKSSKLKRWVRVIYQHFLLNLLCKIWICLNLGIWGKDELKQTSTTNIRGKHFKKKEITSQVQKKKKNAKRDKHFTELTCYSFYALFHNLSIWTIQDSKVHQKFVHFLPYVGRIIIEFCEGTMCLSNFNRYILRFKNAFLKICSNRNSLTGAM